MRPRGAGSVARVIEPRRAGQRFRTSQPGVETWHSFSAGSHYDPDNVAFGPLVGVDEHHLTGGAGFDWHDHRGVVIVSYVLSGVLRHQDSAGTREIGASATLVQSADAVIRHAEGNAAMAEPLRFVQLTVLAGCGARFDVCATPCRIAEPGGYAFVAAGSAEAAGIRLAPGDEVRVSGEALELIGEATLLRWQFAAASR
jgi:quercetin 2,3-dioxygenase